jgi:hypothetical protein
MKTDAEFIARLRKHQRLMRILRWLYLPLALCVVAGLGSLVYETRTVVVMQESSAVPAVQTHALGMIFGLFIASICWIGILCLIGCFCCFIQGSGGTRTQRMLMKYYDLAVTDDPLRDYDNLMAPQADVSLTNTPGDQQ